MMKTTTHRLLRQKWGHRFSTKDRGAARAPGGAGSHGWKGGWGRVVSVLKEEVTPVLGEEKVRSAKL